MLEFGLPISLPITRITCHDINSLIQNDISINHLLTFGTTGILGWLRITPGSTNFIN